MYITKTPLYECLLQSKRSECFSSYGGSLDAYDQADKVWLLQGGNGRFLLQALSKTMNIKLDKKSEALLKEMLRKNSRYGSVGLILNEVVGMFYASEKKKGFRYYNRI